jgi:DNA processing protein
MVERIRASGAVISEFPMEASARPENYPRRNRILSGISAATIIVEAPERSGALITASFAVEQSRDLFVVPGRIDEPTSQGCNRLIQEGGQILLGSQDVIAAMAKHFPSVKAPQKREGAQSQNPTHPSDTRPAAPPLDPAETKVFEAIGEESPQVDELARGLSVPVNQIMGTLLSLELKGAVRRISGSRYTRI